MALSNLGPAVLGSTWGMFFLTTVIVGLRVHARVKFAKFGYDDWITVICWLVFLVTAIITSVVVAWGFGQHVDDIPDADRPRARKGQVIGTASVILSFASPKFGIMATVQRAMNPPTGSWRRIFGMNWALCTASFLFLLSVSVFQFLQCDPVPYQWDLAPAGGSCMDPRVNIRLAYASSSFSTALDFYFSLLPAAIIWKLQMSSRSRVLMIAVLGGASTATFASIIKMWKLGDAIAQIAGDPTYAMAEIYILVYLETTLLIVGSSIAPVFPLFKDLIPGHHGRSDKSGTTTGDKNDVPLRTFGQGTFKRRSRGLFQIADDETIWTRADAAADANSSYASADGIVKTTEVKQTWGSAGPET